MAKLSDLIDELAMIKQQRKEILEKDTELGQYAATLERDIMHAMSEAGTTKAASERGHSVSMSKKTHPIIMDWDQFYDYVVRTKGFDLLHKRLSSTAFNDRWEAGEIIPGSSTSDVWGISLTKSRK
jgi:hypothetical protein